MLFFTLSHSILNIACPNNCVLVGNDAGYGEDRIKSNLAYLPQLGRIESQNQELTDDCTLKIYCERSPQQLNIGIEKPIVAMLN